MNWRDKTYVRLELDPGYPKMFLLACLDTIYSREGEGYAKESTAQLLFFPDFCLVPVTVGFCERVHWLTTLEPR